MTVRPLALPLLLTFALPQAAQQPFAVPLGLVTSDDSTRPALHVASGGLIYRSADVGATRSPVYVLEAGLPQPEVHHLLVEPTYPKNLCVATTLASGVVWKSTDGGATWSRANNGLPSGTGAVERLYARGLELDRTQYSARSGLGEHRRRLVPKFPDHGEMGRAVPFGSLQRRQHTAFRQPSRKRAERRIHDHPSASSASNNVEGGERVFRFAVRITF